MWGDRNPVVIPGEGAPAPQTRNPAARVSANLSRTHALMIARGRITFGAAGFRVSTALRPE